MRKLNGPEYNSWRAIVQRCTNPKCKRYPGYGGRGVEICAEWRHNPEAFIAAVGPRPSSAHTIDRINNQLGYEPGNVRWATAKEQARNRRSNHMLTAHGVTRSLAEWAEETGVEPKTLLKRIELGWDVDAVVGVPLRQAKTATVDGETLTVDEWASRSGIKACTIKARLRSGWPDKEAVFEPRWRLRNSATAA